MDEHAPLSLLDVCLVCVCKSLDLLCSVCDDGSLRLRSCPLVPPQVSDLLLSTMADEGLLNDRTIGIFQDVERLRLERVCVRSSRLSAASVRRSLCCHRLQELDVSRVLGDVAVSDILLGLSSNSVCHQSLHRLNVSGLDRAWGRPVSFRPFQGLRSLSVAWTPLDDSNLQDVCSLPLLESLDISGTAITDLGQLLKLRSTLRSLSVHGLHHLEMTADDFLALLGQLELLTHLDVSRDRMQPGGEMIQKLLQNTQILPALVALDVSGWDGISDEALKVFLEARAGMRFIGLLATGAGQSEWLSGEGTLKVAGQWNVTQLCESLRRYRERESFLHKTLHCLFKHMENDPDIACHPDVLKLVYLGMKAHSESVNIQLSGSSCVFYLTCLDLAREMPQSLLGKIVRHLISTMKTFPDHQQILNYCLLTLCCDYILHVVPFNRCEAAKQVMMCLITNEDQVLQSMCLSTIILLMTQLSLEEISQLGAETSIVKYLLCVVQQKASGGVWDSTFESSLSVLWGLTDSTHSTCTQFIQLSGLELYKELLETYFLNHRVLQQALGLLNNVAEMEDLRVQLMDEDLLQLLLFLLEAKEIDVGYFAAGVLANITSGSTWSLDTTLRDDVLTKLHVAVMSWTFPDTSLVSYRSLCPFCPLLQVSQPSGVQVWALWAIRHICTHNVSRYRTMLEDEGVLDLLHALMSDPDTHSDVHTLTVHTLQLVEEQNTTHT